MEPEPIMDDKAEELSIDYLSDLEKAQILHFFPQLQIKKTEEVTPNEN